MVWSENAPERARTAGGISASMVPSALLCVGHSGAHWLVVSSSQCTAATSFAARRDPVRSWSVKLRGCTGAREAQKRSTCDDACSAC
jgi:hypothetical protein